MEKNTSSKYDDITSKALIRPGSPNIYKLLPKKQNIGTLTRLTFGTKDVTKLNKTILLVGETGSGKSTLINTLVNYTMGVEWVDNLWFDIIEEKKSRSTSQTSDVNVYEIFGFEDRTLPYSLTIIDTPGYGDTRGREHDAIISQRLLDLFRSEDGVHEITAVGLVLKATENRLHPRQKYIFDSVLSLFGKNMENSIVALITHANSRKPKNVLAALEDAKVKCAKDDKSQPVYFKFDNCQDEDREEEPEGLEQADELSTRGIHDFTKFLEQKEPQRLQITVDVLNERIRLKASIKNLKERVEFIEKKQTGIQKLREDLNKEKEEMTRKVKVYEAYKEKVKFDGGRKWWALWLNKIGAMRCKTCEENCHYPCTLAWSPNSCKVMEAGNCTICTRKCPVSAHEKGEWRYEVKTREVWKTLGEMKEKYERKKKVDEPTTTLLNSLEDEMKALQKAKDQWLEESYQHVLTLEDKALNVDALSTHEHLDFLIEKMREKGDVEKAQKLESIKSRQESKRQEETEEGTW